MQKTVDLARGKWRGILMSLGIPGEMLVNRHGPCPLCGDGMDRFRFDDKEGRGTFICNRCGAGDGASLAMKFTGQSFGEVMKCIDVVVGSKSFRPECSASRPGSDNKPSDFMALWSLGKPVNAQDTAGRYLNSRGLVVPDGGSLRFATRGYAGAGDVHPTMVALLADPDGNPVQLHRTFLRPDGQGKAPIAAPRRFMRGEVPSGASVRLHRYEDGPLGIAEGIETAIAAAMLHEMPVWSALDAGKLAKWQPPAQCRSVVIFADNDAHGKGIECAKTLRDRLIDAGLEVTIRMPERVSEDWNDVLLGRHCAAH
jgi:putative DNA primase/helicase